jgi:AraC family transcriptional regulator of adaptative response / DNA-3-methyladenine glycosylase II
MLSETLPPDAAYAVLQAHDVRFDGRLFVGVTSTGIYCRPVCRVRLPRRENCRFFTTAAQAEAERFRPCMKCRPELAPRALPWTTMDASRTLAQQAAAWLDACDDAEASLEDLARHLGITSRHLRRIFQAEHGVSPLQYLQTRRLLLAKALLTDSTPATS